MAIALRDARRGDELAVAELHVRSWQEAYRELMPDEFLAGLDPGERAQRYEFEGGEEAPRTVLAVAVGERDGQGRNGAGFGREGTGFGGEGTGFGVEGAGLGGERGELGGERAGFGGEGAGDDPSLTNSVEVRSGSSPAPFGRAPGGPPGGAEAIVGFATFGPSRDADAVGFGEIYALYVDPESYGGGTGRLLMAEARWRLREAGIEEAILWVLRGNTRARLFYEREGWRADGATRLEQPYGIVSNVTRFRRTLD